MGHWVTLKSNEPAIRHSLAKQTQGKARGKMKEGKEAKSPWTLKHERRRRQWQTMNKESLPDDAECTVADWSVRLHVLNVDGRRVEGLCRGEDGLVLMGCRS